MTHPLSRRRRSSADEADYRLSEPGADHLIRSGFFIASPDLADHDHGTGGWIVFEEPQDLLERKPKDGIAADPDRGRLPHPRLAQSLDDFIGQGATPRHDAHRTLAVDVVGDDAHLGLTRGHQPRTVRPDEFDARILNERARPHHVIERDARGDADDQTDPGGGRLHDGIAGEGRGHEDAADVGAGLAPGVDYRVEDRDAELHAAAFARAHAGDDVRAVGLHLLGVEAPLSAGETLDHDTTLF